MRAGGTPIAVSRLTHSRKPMRITRLIRKGSPMLQRLGAGVYASGTSQPTWATCCHQSSVPAVVKRRGHEQERRRAVGGQRAHEREHRVAVAAVPLRAAARLPPSRSSR